MNCPRCKTAVGPLSSPDSIVTCPGCGSRLMTKAAARRSQGGGAVPPGGAPPEVHPPAVEPSEEEPRPVPTPVPTPTVGPRPTPVPSQPLPPPKTPAPPTSAVVLGAAGARREPAAPGASGYEQVLVELRAVREVQERILAMLEQAMAVPAPRAGADEDAAAISLIRAPRRRNVLLVDDDEATREAAVRELEEADVPVRAFGDGQDALRAIAEDKPDVIVIELGLGGEMAGKDVINVIKATMEWVDIPIVLWTRELVANQKEARQIHGADEIVPKSAGAAGLVARVITVFRRG